MAIFKTLLGVILLSTALHAEEGSKHQITYLMQAGEVSRSIQRYRTWQEELSKHDFEVLQQMALILLDQGARSKEQESQLLSIYGSGVASVASSLDILESGIKSQHPETQVASIQFLGRLQDDRSDELLLKAMSSEFFYVRMEAALQLAMRKHRASVGQIESLMYRVPPQLRFFFPQFFGLIGTTDAISILRHLMEDRFSAVRVEAILSAARFGRDDLLPSIRSCLTHLDVAEQEAAVFAAGLLKDTRSHKRLLNLLKSPQANVQIAAALALHKLGDHSGSSLLLEKAEEEDLFAIQSLGTLHEGADLLARLTKNSDIQVRMNATMALLASRDIRAAVPLAELLLRDSRDMGFLPHLSLGKSHLCWKVIFSAMQHQKQGPYDVFSSTIMLKEQLLTDALELPNEAFLEVARGLLRSKQADLIPLLVHLLENLQTPGAMALLKESATRAGDPLARAYCSLALYRLKEEGPWEENVKAWARRNLDSEMVQFRPMVPIDQRITRSPFELTPEDHSRLLIETFQTIADRHEESGIALFLDALEKGNPKNRFVLAGLLLRALQ